MEKEKNVRVKSVQAVLREATHLDFARTANDHLHCDLVLDGLKAYMDISFLDAAKSNQWDKR